MIAFLISAVRGQIDAGDGWLNRALITQTWDMYLDAFPCGNGEIRMPFYPLQSVTAVQYYDTDGILRAIEVKAADR